MIKRIYTAVATIPLFLAMIYFQGLFLQIGLAFITLIGLYEFSRLGEDNIYWDYLFFAGLSLLGLAYTGLYQSFLVLWLIIQLIYYLIRATFSDYRPLGQLWHVVAVLYVAGLFSFIWLLRINYGIEWTLFGIVLTWITDSVAYFTGINFGKTILSSRISPKKTKEGAVGGLIGAALVGLIFAILYSHSIPLLVMIAIILSFLGQIGDLVESAIKREKQVKDSGKILPGHGGILDRFDSMLFVIPTLYIILTLFKL